MIKTLYKYSDLLEQQRQIIQEKRDSVMNDSSILDFYREKGNDQFSYLISKLKENELIQVCKFISLFHIDNEWSNYLADIADLREGIHLLRLGGEQPVFKFSKISIELFEKMQNNMNFKMMESFKQLKINSDGSIDYSDAGIKAPSATWTYLINDNPFEGMFGIQLIGNISLSIGAGIFGFLLIFYKLWGKLKPKKKS